MRPFAEVGGVGDNVREDTFDGPGVLAEREDGALGEKGCAAALISPVERDRSSVLGAPLGAGLSIPGRRDDGDAVECAR